MPDRGTVIRVLPGNRAVIMSSQCEFKEIRTGKRVRPGDEVVYSPGDVCERRYPVRIVAVAASFILLCVVAWSAFQQAAGARVYAQIAFQINPGFEITVDRNLRVSSAAGFDDRGEALIKSASIVGRDLDGAISEIVRLCLRRNYLNDRAPNYMAVSIYFPGGADNKELLQRLDDRLEAELEENRIDASVYFLQIDKSTRKKALKNRVSPISYLLWEEAERQGISCDLRAGISLKDPRIIEIASRVAIKVGHSFKGKLQTEPGGSDGTPGLQKGEQPASPQDNGMNRHRPQNKPQPSEGPDTGGSKKAAQPAAVEDLLPQKDLKADRPILHGGGEAGTGTVGDKEGNISGRAGTGSNSPGSGMPGNDQDASPPGGADSGGTPSGGSGRTRR